MLSTALPLGIRAGQDPGSARITFAAAGLTTTLDLQITGPCASSEERRRPKSRPSATPACVAAQPAVPRGRRRCALIRLHVNIDHVATLRNARDTLYPDPILAAQLCELAGADGITCHLREDRRHIRDADLARLRSTLTTLLNLEMAATDEMIRIAEQVKPDAITLVPERREERTTEGGLDVVGNRSQIEKTVRMCQRAGIKLSLFIAADSAQIDASRSLGAEQIELHTGEYSLAPSSRERSERLQQLQEGAAHAAGCGLEVAAGHGLNRHNVIAVAAIPEIVELNIGHAIISDAVLLGLERAVSDFRDSIDRGLDRREFSDA